MFGVPDIYGWDWKGCVYEAAKAGRYMIGEQAGGECWIPRNAALTPEGAKKASSGPYLETCQPGGSAYVMHLYSWDEATRQKIVAREGA